MLQAFDHRAADVVTDKSNWVRQGQTEKTSLSTIRIRSTWRCRDSGSTQNDVELHRMGLPWIQGYYESHESTDDDRRCRTVRRLHESFCFVHSDSDSACASDVSLGESERFAYDFVTRQKIGGVTLNFFIVEQVPTLAPDTYAKPCPWERRHDVGGVDQPSGCSS